MALVKSHSNYVLKKKHQNISDGTVYERDITTIGGLNQFSSSVTPIYKSGNFIITVRNDGRSSNEYNTTKFETNDSGSTTWTMETISSMTSDYEDDNETKIILKQDYYDFCDFAYYGSLSELFRASITDILERFPGELYGLPYNIFYTISYTKNGEKIEDREILGEEKLQALDNPYGIDMHSLRMPTDAKPLKYFTNSGYTNYEIITPNSSVESINYWNSELASVILPNEETLDGLYGDDDFYNDELKPIFDSYRKSEHPFLIYSTLSGGTVVEDKKNYSELSENFQKGYINDMYNEYTDGDYKYRVHKDGSQEYETHSKTLSDAENWIKKHGDSASTYTISSGVKCGELECYLGGDKCIGSLIGRVLINGHIIYAYIGENYNIEYVYDSETDNLNGFHIRPTESNIAKFYNECDNFEKILMNRKTTPKYKATFSVMKENSYGYYRQMEEFVFPTTYGDYNLSTEEYGLSTYTKRLVDIGSFYDEYFTDNLYRSMTHESIKNFDWTYTREFYQGDDEEYIEGGEKIQKTLRLFAREFDEIKSYIDAMKNTNCVTYDERSNIPDYFLTDVGENDGWDIKLIYPYSSNSGNTWNVATETTYSQIFNGTVKPYSKDNYTKNYTKYGYFVSCCDSDKDREYIEWGDIDCRYANSSINFVASTGDSSYYDNCASVARNRIRPYLSNKEYSYKDVNNEFLRRLAINSPYIFRHKGTIEGIEMILGMFNLKSQRYVDLISKPCFPSIEADYDITEYSRFSKPLVDKWKDCYMMHEIDWYNSTKTITYDNRNTSNYTLYGSSAASDYSTYQGLPVLCRWKDEDDKTSDWYLYPNFDKDDELDGSPYFQMNGGWMQKQFETDENNVYFQFDRDGNIVTANTPLYKETLLSVKRVDSISDLLSIPSKEIYDNIICYVTHIDKDIAIVNGSVYDVNYDSNGKQYIKFTMQGSGIRVGKDRYFDNDIVVYDSDFEETTYSLLNMPDGYTIKAYINVNGDTEFVCKSLEEGPWYFQSFMLFNPTYGSGITDTLSNYFILKHADYNTSLAYYDNNTKTWSEDGWERLGLDDERLKQVRSSENYFNGNNPHSGKRNYDNGEEYYEYFKHLFKYACENELFDERCHTNFYDVIDTLYESGFTVDSADTVDRKVHYFGHYTDLNGITHYYCDRKTVQCKEKYDTKVKQLGGEKNIKPYILNDLKTYSGKSTDDESLNQIMNNKRLTIRFYVKERYLLEQIKYLDYVVMNYVSQMIPSTTILDIVYELKN